ncbi:hypothetical protein [Microbacterium caowuchunii]|nr:hypothetical protein [Microbacterium caowuchunii]
MQIDTTDVESVIVTYTNGVSATMFPNAIAALVDEAKANGLTVI